ncbi:hypothetical protein [Paenibacillus sp. IHBB 3054]|uniref:hypothetical protein n=1 Tax=Paenibacillus sp. IHBB 3054 TaxID=3425689 RepID=UPI003F6801FC
MSTVSILVQTYLGIEKRYEELVNQYSGLTFIEGSTAVVEGGAYSWSPLSADAASIRERLYADYIDLIKVARETLQSKDSPYFITYEESVKETLAYFAQEDLVFVSSLEEVFKIVKRELDLQRSIICSMMYDS